MKNLEQTKSLPKKELIEFLRNAELDVNYKFVAPISMDEVDRFVHKMRVELSRLRAFVRNRRGRIPKQFKVLFIKAEKVSEGAEITLKKSYKGHEVVAEINEILESLDGGESLNVK